MADIFQPFIQKLVDFGFYSFFFPWIVTTAIMYGLLRKSKVFGDSATMNGTIALSVAFLIIGFPLLFGNPTVFALPLATFFTQATVVILFLAVGFIMASFFYPNLTGFLTGAMKHRSLLGAMIAVAFGLFITSGLLNILLSNFNRPSPTGEQTGPPLDVVTISSGIVIFVVVIIIATVVARGETGG